MDILRDYRCKKIDDYIVVTNYKCMFSSLSKLKGTKIYKKDLYENEIIFVYRHPFIRLISCFLHWGIRSPLKKKVDQQGNVGGWLLKLFNELDNFDLELYKRNLENLNDNDEKLINLFKQFINALPYLFKKNKHLNQQTKIIDDYKLIIDTYINSDIKKEVELLEKKLNTTLSVCNKSDLNKKKLLYDFLHLDDYYMNIVSNIYKDDLELYKRINSI